VIAGEAWYLSFVTNFAPCDCRASLAMTMYLISYMDIETLRNICTGLPHVTEDVKWGNDLCFLIGGKMFCVAGLDQQPLTVSLKVTDEEFDELSNSPGIVPAPYVARYKWILLQDVCRFLLQNGSITLYNHITL
jgi:hypothetical protein